MICLQLMAEPLLRKVTQGFSVARWKNNHHCHHAATDLHSKQEFRMEILILTLCHRWHDHLGRFGLSENSSRVETSLVLQLFFLKYQAISEYFPTLLLPRVNWLMIVLQGCSRAELLPKAPKEELCVPYCRDHSFPLLSWNLCCYL